MTEQRDTGIILSGPRDTQTPWEPNAILIETLETWLEEARSGNLMGAGLVGIFRGGQNSSAFSVISPQDNFTLAGVMQRVINRLVGSCGDEKSQ